MHTTQHATEVFLAHTGAIQIRLLLLLLLYRTQKQKFIARRSQNQPWLNHVDAMYHTMLKHKLDSKGLKLSLY